MPSIALISSDLKHWLKDLVDRARHRAVPVLPSRVPVRRIKRLIAKRGLALINGRPSWFYTAYYRSDPLTHFTLQKIVETLPKSAAILNTGCGTGIMLFWLLDQGFETVEGFDYLPECVAVADEVRTIGGYETRIWKDDGFDPTLTRSYDLITAMHWVFSAWGGNYGNAAAVNPRDPDTRERLLRELLSKYAGHLNPDGRMIIELTDAVADRRAPNDHPYIQDGAQSIYPVRHSPEQVARAAAAVGLEIEHSYLSVSYGHQPRTSYWLRKRAA